MGSDSLGAHQLPIIWELPLQVTLNWYFSELSQLDSDSEADKKWKLPLSRDYFSLCYVVFMDLIILHWCPNSPWHIWGNALLQGLVQSVTVCTRRNFHGCSSVKGATSVSCHSLKSLAHVAHEVDWQEVWLKKNITVSVRQNQNRESPFFFFFALWPPSFPLKFRCCSTPFPKPLLHLEQVFCPL